MLQVRCLLGCRDIVAVPGAAKLQIAELSRSQAPQAGSFLHEQASLQKVYLAC
jgi:hypothetical protein